VTANRFAAWLDSNPDWLPTAAIARGVADESYLGGSDERPTGGGPVTGVPYVAAAAFCSTKGGLRELDQAPESWQGQPPMEWRAGPGGAPSWRRFDGVTSDRLRPGSANRQTGFRCRR
jgi:hypothetical protein